MSVTYSLILKEGVRACLHVCAYCILIRNKKRENERLSTEYMRE